MQKDLQITFKGISHSDAIEQAIRTRVDKLERYKDTLLACHVTLDLPHSHQHKGRLFKACVSVSLPQNEVVVCHQNEDIYAAIRDVFSSVERKVKEVGAKDRGKYQRAAVA